MAQHSLTGPSLVAEHTVNEGTPDMGIPKVDDHLNSEKWTAVPDFVPEFEQGTGNSDTRVTDFAGGSKFENHVALRRGRGRPKGSKNRPKPPSSVWSSPFSRSEDRYSCKFHSLIIERGRPVIQSIAKQASAFFRNGGGLYVIGAQGLLAEVTLEDPQQNRRTLFGAYNIVSFSGLLTGTSNIQISMTVNGPSLQACCGTVFGDFQPLSNLITVQVISYLGAPIYLGQA